VGERVMVWGMQGVKKNNDMKSGERAIQASQRDSARENEREMKGDRVHESERTSET